MLVSSRNAQAMKTMLLELWQGKSYLRSVPGTVGETAKVDKNLKLCKVKDCGVLQKSDLPTSLSSCFLPQVIESYVSQLR